MKQFLFTTLVICAFMRLFAVPAYPYPVVFTQPNGEQVTLIMQGDEFVRFAQTLDGYTLLYNSEGYFCYAQKNAQGDLEPSAFVAEDISNRSDVVNQMLTNTSKKLHYSENQISTYRQIRQMVETEHQNNRDNTTGVRKLLTILMQYPDRPFIKTQEDFHNMFNQVKYTEYGANGSVKDFFLESSYNKLEVQTTVVGPFMAKNNHSYYGDFSYARELAHEAVFAAHDAGVDFSDFAVNGEVPSFYMIFQGHGQEAGAGTDCIWSHAWGIEPVYFNGVRVSSYACSPELRGSGGKEITWIGVICHEFGHSLGAPDYYDTDYGTGGQYDGTGTWDLQASGSWNDNGRTPAPPNPLSKIYTYEWATVTELNSAQTVTIPSARIYDNAYYRINTQTPNEFYLLENKIKGGYDDYTPGVDMLIYHKAANMDGMNTTSPQKFYPVAANAPVDLPSSGTNCQTDYGSVSSSLCPWPGYTEKNEFTNTTIPAMIDWNRQPTNKPINNITIHGDYITFDILGGGPKNDHTVFLPAYYGCTIISESGSVSPTATGSNFHFKITITDSHNQSDIVVKSNGQTITPVSDIYTLSNIQSDQIVTIEGLKFNTVNIISSAGVNGTVSPIGIVEVPLNNVQHFDIIPNIGYSVDEVFIDGVSVGAVKHHVFKNVTEPHSIFARFKYGTTYFINPSPDVLKFDAHPGIPSQTQIVTVTSPELIGNIQVVAPAKFEISNNGTKWYKSFSISRIQLPYQLHVRYSPEADDRENALGKITLCSIEAYSEIILIGNIALEISENTVSKFVIYPNPTTGELRIGMSDIRCLISDILIYDVFGRIRKIENQKSEIGKSEIKINISHLPSGIYLLAIKTSSNTYYEKIIKH
jgi:M6 family metalloprotease-like protein